MLSTDQKGGIAELAIALAAARLGIDVYRPLQEGGRYDLIFGAGGALARVQCKWANRYDDVIVVRAYRCRRTAAGLLQRGYSVDEIDAVAAYCSELDTCYFIPLDILFSAWFFYLVRKGLEVFGRAMGWRDLGWDAAGFPFTRSQAAGAWIALFFLLVWAERHHLRRVMHEIEKLVKELYQTPKAKVDADALP